MTEKEKAIQRALGTLPTFSVTVRVDLSESTRQEALKESREMILLLRRNFPNFSFKKNTMKNIEN